MAGCVRGRDGSELEETSGILGLGQRQEFKTMGSRAEDMRPDGICLSRKLLSVPDTDLEWLESVWKQKTKTKEQLSWIPFEKAETS